MLRRPPTRIPLRNEDVEELVQAEKELKEKSSKTAASGELFCLFCNSIHPLLPLGQFVTTSSSYLPVSILLLLCYAHPCG